MNIVCIGCPIGCNLEVEFDGKVVKQVKGNKCKVGKEYGKKECINPTRILTTTVAVEGGRNRGVSVKTDRDIPKGSIFECIYELKNLKVKAPVKIGEILLDNVAGIGANIVATSNCRSL